MEDKIPEQLMEIILKHSAFEQNEINLDTSINLDYRSGMSHYDAILFFDDLYDLYHIEFPKVPCQSYNGRNALYQRSRVLS